MDFLATFLAEVGSESLRLGEGVDIVCIQIFKEKKFVDILGRSLRPLWRFG